MQKMLDLWQTLPLFDEETKLAVRNLSPDEQAAAFGAELAFGTGGLRGILGVGTNQMNVYTVAKVTQGLSRYLKKTGGKKVAIAYDTRHFSKEFAQTAACVLAKNGLTAYVFDVPRPTPMLSFAVREMGCDAGIVVTASHNPAQYNGYKVYGADGCQITDAVADAITKCIRGVKYEKLGWLALKAAKAKGLFQDMPNHVYDAYIQKTLAVLNGLDTEGELRVVYTPLHGTGLEPVTDVLGQLRGVEYVLVKKQLKPDGNFPTCLKPNPETEEALTLGLKQLKKEQADILIATDPDSDRLGVVARDGKGFYRLSGNEVGLVLTEYLLSKRVYRAAPTVIKTIVTSDLVFPIAEKYGAKVAEVLTGCKYIGEYIGEMEARGELDLFALGFEESCGYLAAPHVRDKDGVLAAALICVVARTLKKQGKTLADAVRKIYEEYGYLENKLLEFERKGVTAKADMARLMRGIRKKPPETLAGEKVIHIKDYKPGLDGLPPSDVLCFETDGGSKALIRPSGTEPKVKVYLFAKAKSRDAAALKIEAMEAWFEKRQRR